MSEADPSSGAGAVPEAVVEPRRGGAGLVWIVPIAAIVVTAIVGWRAWQARGVPVAVGFAEAHGLREGDPVRSRGVDVGVVREVVLVADDAGDTTVQVRLSLDREARGLLRAGTRFWIQRPQVDFDGIEGLDTLAGSRWVGLDPGSGPRTGGPFAGLDAPPVTTDPDDAALEIVLEATTRLGMRPGGAVTYRGVVVGMITDLGLAADARRVEARVRIEARYAGLVRERTRFFATSGIGLELGFKGVRADIESLESIITGGVALATPPEAGSRAATGARFDLAEKPEDVWIAWAPRLAIGSLEQAEPERTRATLRWKVGLLGRERSRTGWAVRVPDGRLLVPAGLLTSPADGRDLRFELLGRSAPLDRVTASIAAEGLADGPVVGWITAIDGTPTAELEGLDGSAVVAIATEIVEDATLLVCTDPGREPIPVPGHLWRRGNDGIVIDAGAGLADIDDGAAVLDGDSGTLLGVLVIEAGEARLARIAPGR